MKVGQGFVLVFACWGATLSPGKVLGADFAWQPVSATGAHTIVGHEIILTGVGQQVTLELRLSGWDTDMDGTPKIGTYQGTLDASGYSNGVGTPLAPLTVPNALAGAFQILNRCTINQMLNPNGAPCDNDPCPVNEFCASNPDFVFTGLQPFAAVNVSDLNYQFGATILSATGKSDGGLSYYGGTLILVVPPTAKGRYTIGFVNNAGFSFLLAVEPNNPDPSITPLTLTPAVITIGCTGIAECNDDNACTNDECTNNTCAYPLNYNPAQNCCNPTSGVVAPLSDGNDCTDDVCNMATGAVTHPNSLLGSTCGSTTADECDDPDSCDGAGVCLTNHVAQGTACGNHATSPCNLPDTCDAAGACQSNLKTPGTACGNSANTDCTLPDTCDAIGACRPNHRPNGTLCSDGMFCTQGEFCTTGICGGGGGVSCDDLLICTQNLCNETADRCDNPIVLAKCLIAGGCFEHAQINPLNPCQICDAGANPTTWTPRVPSPQCSGDFDLDGDRQLDDFLDLVQCLSGPSVGHPGGNCPIGDFDGDGYADLFDLAGFQQVFTGP